MNVTEFAHYFHDLLANSGAPEIAGVDYWDAQTGEHPIKDPAVRCADGRTLFLRIVRTSPPGGDNSGQGAVTKAAPGVAVTGD